MESPLSQLKTKLLNSIETNYVVTVPGGLAPARRAVTEVVDEIFKATGDCEKCFGRGYLIAHQAGKLCDCERGQNLSNFIGAYYGGRLQ